MRLILINILLLLYSLSLQSQTYDTLTVCNGDSIFNYNNWESQPVFILMVLIIQL